MMVLINKGAIVIPLISNLLVALLSNVQADIKVGGDFSLLDHDSQKFELQQLRGNVVLLFFGYTSCPDVCPTGLGKMAQILSTFEKKSNNVKGLFISVDPERDSPQKLKQYTSYFSGQLLGLTGSREQLDRVADLYRVHYQIHQNAENQTVVDHSSNLYVVDKRGDLNTIVPFGMSVNHVIKIVDWLLENKPVG